MSEFSVASNGITLHGDDDGEGPPILLLHGLSATRRYVLHGSTALIREGYRLIAYDARGHGESDPAPASTAYGYAAMVQDAVQVMDDRGIDRAVVVGMSMGAAVGAALALAHPDRVRAFVAITPAHLGHPSREPDKWNRLADGLEQGGPDGFVDAYGDPGVDPKSLELIRTVMRQRLARHAHPDAVANCLRFTTADAAFDREQALAGIACPTLVIGSRDRLDPEHPIRTAERWAELIPGAKFIIESDGESPLAWRGGTLSREVAAFLVPLPG